VTAINVYVIENGLMTFNAADLESSVTYNSNCQDAREGGESPPLPRNCERPASEPVVLGEG
jgi:hypothetical protein